MGYNLNVLFNNVYGLNSSKKRIKMFEYFGRKLQIMRYYSYKKLIPLMTLSLTGVMIIKANCFFHMEPQIHTA